MMVAVEFLFMVVRLVLVVIIYGSIDRNLFDPLFQMLDVIQLRNILKYTNEDLLVYVFRFLTIDIGCKLGSVLLFCSMRSVPYLRQTRPQGE